MKTRTFTAAAACAALLFTVAAPQAMALSRQEEANLKVASDFTREVLQAHNVAAATKYYAPDMKQHNPNVPSGLQGFQEFFGKIWKAPLPVKAELDPKPEEIVVQGDIVMMMFKRATQEPTDPTKTYETFWWDMFRVKDGKIVEHWDPALKPVPKT
jgi:predicted SnoaL-like aldol condensation-catalyzing enzyme